MTSTGLSAYIDKSADIQSSFSYRPETLFQLMLVLLMWKSLETNPQMFNHHRHIVPRTSTSSSLSAHSGKAKLGDKSADVQSSMSNPLHSSTSTQLQLKIVWMGLEENMHTYNEGINGMPIRDMINFPFFDQVIKS